MNFHRPYFFSRSLLATAIVITGCTTGPDYQRPSIAVPAQWSEQHNDDGWRTATPDDARAKGSWWELFNDSQLNALQAQAQLGNLNLQAATARLDQARALAQLSHAELLPRIDLEAQHSRTRTSANRPNNGNSNSVRSTLRDDNTVALAASYEIDLFGRVRRTIEASNADTEQATADLENIKLLLAADVAINYFNLRALENERAVLAQTLTVQSKILDVVQGRYADGFASGIDLAQQELTVANNRSQQQLVEQQYALQRHALATLLGITVGELQISATPLPATPPTIPLLLAGDLLQRRPDIAQAERAVASANAQIGVARAARFPSFNINARDGFESAPFAQLFDAPSAVWSLGISATQIIFDGGRARSRENYARAHHREMTANYRNTVLSAWQEVEDKLSNARTLAAAHDEAQHARAAAIKIADISDDRYVAGMASAIERYTARQNALNAQRDEVHLAAQRWINAVALVKALGGGWDTDALARTE